MRGGFRGAGGVVSTPDAASIAGVTPGATGLAVLDDATPAAARDTVVWASAGAIDPASPYTVAAGIDRVTFASSKTLAPRALSNYANGQTIIVTNSSASTITVTIAPADGTINGGASVALTVLAHAVVGCQRVSASAWVSLQPGSAAVKRITATTLGGVFIAYGEAWLGGAWVQITPTMTSTLSGDPDGLGATVSGNVLSWGNGSAVIGTNLATEAQYVGWALADIATGLGLDSIRPLAMQVLVDTVSVTSGSAGDYSALFGAIGTGAALATDMSYAVGVRVNNAGNSASRAVTGVTGVGYTGGTTGTVRRAFFAGATPFAAAALGYVYAYDTSDVIVNSLAVANTLVAGTPTHLFVCWGASTNQKTTSFTAPIVRLFL